jgi:hypothetical protein
VRRVKVLMSKMDKSLACLEFLCVNGVPVDKKIDDWAVISREISDQSIECTNSKPIVLKSRDEK